eukprot:6462973-Amphidinium_carterae.2
MPTVTTVKDNSNSTINNLRSNRPTKTKVRGNHNTITSTTTKELGVHHIQETSDYYGYHDDNQSWYPEVDYSQPQPIEEQPSQQLLGTPSQPQVPHNNQKWECSTRLTRSTTSTSTDSHHDNVKTSGQSSLTHWSSSQRLPNDIHRAHPNHTNS